MDYAGKINKPMYSNYSGSVNIVDNKNSNSGFREVLKNKLDCFSENKCSDCLKGAIVAPMLQRKIDSISDTKISDITRVHYPTEKEPGERVFEAIMPGTGIRVNISLRPCSMDYDIDQNKLREIFKKIFMFCERILPIEQKLSTGKIEAMGIMSLPFDPETGEVDFKERFKDLYEACSIDIKNSKLDESVKKELLKMLKECEKALFEAFDEEEKREKELHNNKALQTV